MLRILIQDTDPDTGKKTEREFCCYLKKKKISFQIERYTSIADVPSTHPYDLVYCDIKQADMQEENILELIRQVKQKNKYVLVFLITDSQDYLDTALEMHVFRYLSKPVTHTRFDRCLDAALDQYYKRTAPVVIESDETYRIYIKDILFVAIENRHTVIHTAARAYETNDSFTVWRKRLEEFPCFTQSHQSYYVNLKYVEHFDKDEVVLKGDNQKLFQLPLSRRKYASFKKTFTLYHRSQLT